MEYIIYNGELYHHGVKGMKWGVRKQSIISDTDHDSRIPDWVKSKPKKHNRLDLLKKSTRSIESDIGRRQEQKKLQKAQKKWDKKYQRYINEYQTSFKKVMDKKMTELIGERPK